MLQELIQNAEDAGASEVEITHDTRTLQFPETRQDIHRFVTVGGFLFFSGTCFVPNRIRLFVFLYSQYIRHENHSEYKMVVQC